MSELPVILITGASSGIGAAMARLFGRHGYRVVLAARRIERLESLAGEIEEEGGIALPLQTDITQLDQIQALVDQAIGHFDQIDVLVNNAGLAD